MNVKHTYVFFIIVLICFWACSGKEENDVQFGPAKTFPLDQVELLEGPFKHATDLNINTLLKYEPDRLLARFRMEAGLEPKAEPYGGWEGMSLAGHSLGHYLSACALMFQTTGNQIFNDRARYIVTELEEIQAAHGGQFFAAFGNGRKVFEEEVSKGNIDAQSFYLNGIWAPFYTFHKIMSGLRDVYRVFNFEEALKVEKNLADWIGSILEQMNHDQIQTMLGCEFGGIQESLVDLYQDTQDEKYLGLAKAFHHEAVIDSLIAGKDILAGIHGNTQIPKLIAAARLYEITEEEKYKAASAFFWNRVVHHHSYVTGGHGNHEYFGQPDQLTNRLSDGTTETCNVYNMLKLTRHLFTWHPDAEKADFYERALFNHILSAQHPETGRVIYNLSLEMGGYKHYQNPFGFTCCVGTGMETHSKHGANIYYHDDQSLYVNQFIASKLNWEEKGLTISQFTSYPDSQVTRLVFEMEQPVELEVKVRYPSWCTEEVSASVNGWVQDIKKQPGSYMVFKRKWKTNDTLTIRMPFSLRLEEMPDDDSRIAVFYGPVLLAGDLGPEEDPLANTKDYVPVLMSEERNPSLWLDPVEGMVNTFRTLGVGHPKEITFKPFYKIHNRRYSVYFDLYNQEKWEVRQNALLEEETRKAKLEELTIDAFQPGDEQEEISHGLEGELLNMERNFKGRMARGTERGGWLSFSLGVRPDVPTDLVLEYWGGFTGSKTFDILVEGQLIATENISGKKDGHFIDIHYPIPDSLILEKKEIKVKFEPHAGHRSGPFFYARTVERMLE